MSLELSECLWRFSIPSLNLSHSFLLVGHTSEPAVSLDRAYVSFKCMLLRKSIYSNSLILGLTYSNIVLISIHSELKCIKMNALPFKM